MSEVVETVGSHRVLEFAGPVVADERGVDDLISAVWEHDATFVAVPVSCLSDAVFALSSGLMGVLTQKLVNYHIGLAIVGDVSAHTARSQALRDFVQEASRGNGLIFVADIDALRARLSR